MAESNGVTITSNVT